LIHPQVFSAYTVTNSFSVASPRPIDSPDFLTDDAKDGVSVMEDDRTNRTALLAGTRGVGIALVDTMSLLPCTDGTVLGGEDTIWVLDSVLGDGVAGVFLSRGFMVLLGLLSLKILDDDAPLSLLSPLSSVRLPSSLPTYRSVATGILEGEDALETAGEDIVTLEVCLFEAGEIMVVEEFSPTISLVS
jgi:hypothetical protein